MSTLQARQPKGIRTGGQFSGISHTESGISLAHPALGGRYADPDGTRWSPARLDNDGHLVATDGRVVMELRDHGSKVSWSVTDGGAGVSEPVGTGAADSLGEAKEAAKEARLQAYLHGVTGMEPGADTPWGPVETTRLTAPGIATVHTEEHEGFKLSPERNAAIDPRWREESGWYEADVKGEIVIVSNPDLFSPGEVEEAHCILRSYHPDEHEAVVGARPERFGLANYSPIQPGESFIRDWNTLWQDKRETHLQSYGVEYSAEHPDHVVVTLAEPR
jgi:hypothetical protein